MNRDFTMISSDANSDIDMTCPNCGSGNVKTAHGPLSFEYGEPPDAVKLTVVVPYRTCLKCNFQFLDSDAEDVKHDAICRHLQVMTPQQIRALRDYYKLTRSEFARLTHLGEATLGRWERGALIQNAAYDHFLYLLTFPENIARLRMRGCPEVGPIEDTARPMRRFRVLRGHTLAQAELARADFRLIPDYEAA
jgi:putative zinc finger/helix-turn-helix YgiT family protein